MASEHREYRHSVCIKSELCQEYRGCLIYKEFDKYVNPFTLQPQGHARVFYAIYIVDEDEEILTESFKTLQTAKNYIDYIT